MRLRSPQELTKELEKSPKRPTRADDGALVDEARRSREELAASRLEIALIFARSNKLDIARGRLRRITIEFEGTAAAHHASATLKKLAHPARA